MRVGEAGSGVWVGRVGLRGVWALARAAGALPGRGRVARQRAKAGAALSAQAVQWPLQLRPAAMLAAREMPC